MMSRDLKRGSGPVEPDESAAAFSSSGKMISKCSSIANLRVAVRFERVLRHSTLTLKFLFDISTPIVDTMNALS
jgi:hypothetical protein